MVIRVQTRDNEPVDKALRRLRKLCNNEGLTRVTKAKAYFEKPSERRRRESRERLKAIRISCRAREQDAAKLMQRRRKARKAARSRSDDLGSEGEEVAPRPHGGPAHGERSAGPGPRPGAPRSAGPRGPAPHDKATVEVRSGD